MKVNLFLFIYFIPTLAFANIDLSFRIDENYLIIHTLVKGRSIGKFSGDVKVFQNEVFEDFKSIYKRLQKVPISLINPVAIKKEKFNFFNDIVPKIKKMPSYKKILTQTFNYRHEVEDEWVKNYTESFKMVKEITGLSLKEKFEIIITHPAVGNGVNLRNYTIAWGSWPRWKNYSTVYLWHEIFHSFLVDKSNIEHSIIQYITDNHLRKTLSGINYPPYEGHKRLIQTMKIMKIDWGLYLKSQNKNILEFSRSMHRKYKSKIKYF